MHLQASCYTSLKHKQKEKLYKVLEKNQEKGIHLLAYSQNCSVTLGKPQ